MAPPKTAMVVDDSPEVRQRLRERAYTRAQLEVVAASPRGELSVQRMLRAMPDVLVVSADIDGAELNALAEELREYHPKLLIMMYDVSSADDSGSFSTSDDRIHARQTQRLNWDERYREDTPRASPAHVPRTTRRRVADQSFDQRPRTLVEGGPIDAIVIGVSTGGPPALHDLLPEFPVHFPPIFVVQHMMQEFITPLAKRLDACSDMSVREPRHGTPVTDSTCWLAPGDRHMRLRAERRGPVITLDRGERVQSSRPSVDVLFESAAEVYGSRLLAVVMTGMGCDGLDGCAAVREAGGHVIVQDEASSVVWGMPGSVHEAGLAHEVIPLDMLAWTIRQRVRSSRRGSGVRAQRGGGKS